jgi:urease accessory protein
MRHAMIPLLLLLPSTALAHSGSHAGAGFAQGLLHPLAGSDHLLAMLAVGLWSAQAGGRALWAAPAAFLCAMILGAAAGALSLPFPGVEPAILASVVILGAAVALALRPPLAAALGAVAVFGLAHGHAHGTEAAGAALLPYMAGFAIATAALHGAGAGLGLALALRVRWIGGATVAAGAALALAG